MNPRKPPIKPPVKTAAAPPVPSPAQQAENFRRLEDARSALQSRFLELKGHMDSKVLVSQKSEDEKAKEKESINASVDEAFNLEMFNRDEGLKSLFVVALNFIKLQRDRINMQELMVKRLNAKVDELEKLTKEKSTPNS